MSVASWLKDNVRPIMWLRTKEIRIGRRIAVDLTTSRETPLAAHIKIKRKR